MAENERIEDTLDIKAPPGKTGGPSKVSPEGRPKSRFRRFFLPLLLIFMTLISLVQFAGTLLRDKLEGRTIASPQELVLRAIEKFAPKHHESAEGSGRGFGVTEIPVGEAPGGAGESSAQHSGASASTHGEATKSGHGEPVKIAAAETKNPDHSAHTKAADQPKELKPAAKADAGSSPKENAAKPTLVKEPPKPVDRKTSAKTEVKPEAKAEAAPKSPAKTEARLEPKPVQQQLEDKKEAPPPPKKEEAPKAAAKVPSGARFAPDPTGGYAVAVGAFNSQRLASMVEKRLDDLGFPHTRAIIMKNADGYTVAISAASEAVVANAAKALSDGGYRADKAGNGLTLRFISQEEAEKAKAVAEKAGAEGSIKKAVGQVPLWRVLVGPTTAETARKSQEILKAEGMESVVVRYKP